MAPAEKGEMKMFSQLVESDLHTGEFKRKGTFFLATMAAYALVLMLTGVAGVYAYEAQIDDQNLELVALVPPETETPRPREAEPRTRTAAPDARNNTANARNSGGPKATAPSNTSSDLTRIAGTAQAATTQLPPQNVGGGDRTFPFSAAPYNPNAGKGGPSSTKDGDGEGIINEQPPAAIVKKSEPPPKQRIAYIGPVNSRALSLPQPSYPAVAKVAGVQGPVTVEILIDEAGRVMTAQATSGHPLLRLESERAAYRARFSPTLLQNQPVKAKGVITFNFILNR
jgi:TonB family protein